MTIDLGADSALSEFDSRSQSYYTLADDKVDHFDPMCTSPGQTNRHHFTGHHEYKVAKTILSADVIIYVPKLKTHKKAGVTLSLKNSIGIVGGKVYMPHHRPGQPPEGDAYPEPPPRSFLWKRAFYLALMRHPQWGPAVHEQLRRLKRLFQTPTSARAGEKSVPIEWGDWSGNDTIWRSIVDLNRILLYADSSGVMRDRPQRQYLSIVDGIVGQEGEGPMSGHPKACGLVLSGTDPVAVDLVAVRAMGFDWQKIPLMRNIGLTSKYPLGMVPPGEVELRIAGGRDLPSLGFRPPRGWKNVRLPIEQHLGAETEKLPGAAARP